MQSDAVSSSRPPKYRRIVIKLSGEALRNQDSGDSIDPETLDYICDELAPVYQMGVEIALVVGGGNIFRGLAGAEGGVDRTTGDHMGMLATVINGLALMDALEKRGIEVRVQSAIPMERLAEPFILRKATRHLEKKRIVIFVAGTGNPYFSTDTTAALRASEIDAEVIMKATNVDGVYNKDPNKHADATRFENVSYIDALRERLKVMDSTAFTLCMDNRMPILVFNLREAGGILKAVSGEEIGTLVS
jgi:uridylate kinase